MRPLLLALLLTSLLAACGKSDKNPEAAAGKTAASALLLAPEDLLDLVSSQQAFGPLITGSILPERRADLRAEVGSVVVQVLKENGEAVHTGDLLMRLDDTAIRDNLGSAESAARSATQALEQAERQVQRLKTLQAQGMTSTQALEDAEVRRNSARSEQVAASARVVTARQQLQRTNVRAPFDGLVSERQVSVGDTVQVGRELVKVIDPKSMRFEGLVSADRLQDMKLGQRVRFRVNGFGDAELLGKVKRIDATANSTTRQVAVAVSLDDPDHAPRVAGLFAEGRIEVGASQVLMLPESALLRTPQDVAVWRVDGQQLVRVPVRLDERDARSGQFPVLSGLAAGQTLLRHPGSALKAGQIVERVAPGTAAAASAPQASASTAG
jgi:membrane fusion protein, multidrug efflux system